MCCVVKKIEILWYANRISVLTNQSPLKQAVHWARNSQFLSTPGETVSSTVAFDSASAVIVSDVASVMGTVVAVAVVVVKASGVASVVGTAEVVAVVVVSVVIVCSAAVSDALVADFVASVVDNTAGLACSISSRISEDNAVCPYR